jgi:hypothetical protein
VLPPRSALTLARHARSNPRIARDAACSEQPFRARLLLPCSPLALLKAGAQVLLQSQLLCPQAPAWLSDVAAFLTFLRTKPPRPARGPTMSSPSAFSRSRMAGAGAAAPRALRRLIVLLVLLCSSTAELACLEKDAVCDVLSDFYAATHGAGPWVHEWPTTPAAPASYCSFHGLVCRDGALTTLCVRPAASPSVYLSPSVYRPEWSHTWVVAHAALPVPPRRASSSLLLRLRVRARAHHLAPQATQQRQPGGHAARVVRPALLARGAQPDGELAHGHAASLILQHDQPDLRVRERGGAAHLHSTASHPPAEMWQITSCAALCRLSGP